MFLLKKQHLLVYYYLDQLIYIEIIYVIHTHNDFWNFLLETDFKCIIFWDYKVKKCKSDN